MVRYSRRNNTHTRTYARIVEASHLVLIGGDDQHDSVAVLRRFIPSNNKKGGRTRGRGHVLKHKNACHCKKMHGRTQGHKPNQTKSTDHNTASRPCNYEDRYIYRAVSDKKEASASDRAVEKKTWRNKSVLGFKRKKIPWLCTCRESFNITVYFNTQYAYICIYQYFTGDRSISTPPPTPKSIYFCSALAGSLHSSDSIPPGSTLFPGFFSNLQPWLIPGGIS